MRRTTSATAIGCACAIVLLSGCGANFQRSTSNTTPVTQPSAGFLTNVANRPSDGSGAHSNQTAASQTSSLTGNQSTGSASTRGQTAGQSSNQTTNSQGGSSSSGSQAAGQTGNGQGASSPGNPGGDFTSVSAGTLSNELAIKFSPKSWNGLGEAAVLVTPPNSYGMNGNLLYILADASHTGTGTSTATLLDSHTMSAEFSTDGKWLAVETLTGQGGVVSQNQTSHLWLMSADGKQRIYLGPVSYVQGAWTSAGTFIYTDGTGHVYSVQPGQSPVALPLSLSAGVTVQAIRINPKTGQIAFDEVVPDADKNIVDRHDVINLWNPQTGSVKPLVTAAKGDGFILGPWTADGTRLFYWPDPLHSGSIAADGLQLQTVDANGQKQSVSTTLVGMGTVQPLQANRAIIQVGGTRYLYVKKSVELWNGSKIVPLPGSTSGTSGAGSTTDSGSAHGSSGSSSGNGAGVSEVWPTVNDSGSMVAFSEGPVLSALVSGTVASQWWQHLQLVTVNLKTGQRTVVTSAGKGVVQPMFTADGQHLMYITGSQLNEVGLSDLSGANGSTANQTAFEASAIGSSGTSSGGSTASSNGASASVTQWSMSLPVEVVDYHR